MEDNKFTIESDAVVPLLRQVSPYFLQHRNSLFVIHIEGEAIEPPGFQNLARDLILLAAVGIRIIVVFGADRQITSRLTANNITLREVSDTIVMDLECMAHIREVVGAMRLSIESNFSYVRDGAPMKMGAMTKISSGNFISAKSKGIVEGRDMMFSGDLRSLDAKGISESLDRGEIVLIPPVGFGSSGELFNLDSQTLAYEISANFQSEKLIFLHEEEGIFCEGNIVRQMSVGKAELDLADGKIGGGLAKYLPIGAQSCRKGVARVHFISYLSDGAILRELFTRDGVGTMLSDVPFDNLRPAMQVDVLEILELITPMQEQGILLARTYDSLLKDLDDFIVIIREDTVVATAALHQYKGTQQGEIACVAVHQDYRGDEFGDMLLSELELRAGSCEVSELFVLTTHAIDWFEERGYTLGAKTDLPKARLGTYSDSRNSVILTKKL
jgi:amino-acid N-acetyltransferase